MIQGISQKNNLDINFQNNNVVIVRDKEKGIFSVNDFVESV